MKRELFILTIFASVFIKGVKVTEPASESVLSANSYTFIETTPTTEYGAITSTNTEIYFSNENVIEGTTIKDESSSTDLNKFRATEEDCTDGLEFTINRTEENLAVSLKTNKTCNVNYYIHLTKAYNDNRHDVPYFRRDNKIFHKIKKKLFQCSAYNISIEVGFTPVYEQIIWTLPGQVENLLISAKNNKTEVSWTPSTYPNCSDYYIYVDDKSYRKTSTTSYIFDGNLYCTKFGIEIVGKDNNVGKRVTAIVPGPVLELSIVETTTSLTINWNPPEIYDCVTGYKIEIDTTSIEVEDTSLELNNLESCTTYTVSVSAKSETIYGEPVTKTSRTGTPAQIFSVSNLALTVVDNVLHVAWTPPAQQGACIQSYRVLLWDDNNDTEDFKTTATYYDFSPLVGCMTYNVQITPIVSEAQEGVLAFNNKKIDPLPTDPPKLRNLAIDKTWAEMTFTLESFADNRCTITKVSVHCDGVNNENYPWVIGSQDAFVDYTDSTSRPVAKVSVTGLSEFTNYSCVAVVENEGGISENSEPIEFQTLAEVPSIPQNLQLAMRTDTSFMVTWDQPAKVPGILENYKIETITNRNLHYLPDECSVPNNTKISIKEADVTFHDVIDAFPNFEYILEVSAMTVDYGPSATLYVNTYPSASEVPRSVDYDFRNIFGENYNVTLLLSWVLPCSTNGNLSNFEIETLGFSLDDPLEESHHQVISVPPNDPIENETYYLEIPDIKGFFNYSMEIKAIVSNSTDTIEGEPYEITFLSPDGLPSAPINVRSSEATEYSVLISWDEPISKNGELQEYNVTIVSIGPLHNVANGCEIHELHQTYEIPATTNQFRFNEGFPNYNYTVTVRASTSVDFGIESEIISFQTLNSASEIPRNVEYDFKNILGEVYDVTLLLNWSLPCNTNGKLSLFQVDILGFSLEDPSEEQLFLENVAPNDPIEEETYYLEVSDIKGFFNYTVKLKAIISEEIEGEPYEITFLSPDGLPSAPINVRSSEATEYSVLISWDEPISKNGELQEYNVTIVSIGPLHNVANGCETHELHQTYEIPATTNQFRFNEGFPNYNYTVTVRASTSVDFGIDSEIISFQTLNSASEIPRNVEYDFKNILGEVYDVTLLLYWSLPCNTNGKLSLFQVDILGFSLEDPSDEQILLESVAPNDPIEEETYYWEVSDIKGFFNYTVKLKAIISEEIEGEPYEITFLSPDGYPSAPVNVRTSETTANSVLVSWEEPLSKNGELRQYNVSIVSIGPLHNVGDDCETHGLYETYMVSADENEFRFDDGVSNYNYTVIIRASTSVGFGVNSEIISFQTLPTDPDMVRNLNTEINFTENELYNADVTISFLKPCNTNGIFQEYNVTLMGTRAGFDDVILETTIKEYANNTVTFNLKPQYNYTGGIQVRNTQFTSETYEIEQFTAPAGVPTDDISELQAPIADGSQTASFLLSSDLFSTTNGDILYYALILTRGEKQNDDETYGFWDGTTWPSIGVWSHEDAITYQTNEEFWNPFVTKTIENFTYVIGIENCTEVTGFCNGPLTPGTEYKFRVRGFTYNGFRDTMSVSFITPADLDNSLNWALILGLTFGILAFLLVTLFIFILWRKKKKDKFENIETTTIPFLPLPITTKEFPEHYDDYKEHLHKFKDEFTLLSKISAENALLTTIGISEENKKKNRYINILPYDDTRVILADNNANYTDYINASYIKGYSGSVEYIATQGPLESTVVDFWRMVMQENISVIVMVAQFVEQTKQKCHKYFPDNHEIMEIGDGIEIKCSNELNFGVYIVRNLLVQREQTQWSITHLQFMDWPDFGCPSGTQAMLQFCKVMRQHIERDKNKTIIHCSAGVGRTGTLIAIDILLQTIENNGDINVFETVLKLRKQRSHMVQTEKQYVYIHSCVKDNILNPIKFDEKKSEPIYENIDLLQAELNGKAIAESAL